MRSITLTIISLILVLNLTLPAKAYWTDELPLTTHESNFYQIDRPLEGSIISESKDYGITQIIPTPDNKRLKDLRLRILVINFPGDLRDYSQAVANEFKRRTVNGTFEYVTLDSESATRFVYETKDDHDPIKIIRIYTLKDGRVFDLQFSFPAHRYNDLRPLVDRLLSTFRITGSSR